MKSKIKIARIVTVPIAFTHILDLLKTIDSDDRFELHIICSEGPYLIDLKKNLKSSIFHTLKISREINLISDIISLIKLSNIFYKCKFDIVHSHTPKAGLLTALAARITFTNVRLHTFTGQVWVGLKGVKKKVLISLDKLIVQLNSHNFTDSFGQLDFLILNQITTNKNTSVVHNGSFGGIDIDRFNKERILDRTDSLRANLFPNFDGKIIIYLGRINEEKGIKELYYAFSELKQTYNLRLLLVGPLESDLKSDFNNLVIKIKEDKDVALINFTEEPEIYLGIADIFCFPSYREGFGTAALEASSMKLPIVASNIYGLSEAVVANKTGLLFESKNKNELVRKLAELIENEKLARELGENGRLRVEKDFNEKEMTKKMIDYYLSQVR